MATVSSPQATLDDLRRVDEKAELIGGRIEYIMPSGDLPTDAAGEIYISLHAHAKATGKGKAKTDGVGYAVPVLSSGRESFCPDASFYDGPLPKKRMRFIEGPPNFAAEVRSENDYGPAAEAKIAAKRADYFESGTKVVWDVDPQEETVTVYRFDDPNNPVVYKRGEIADAEPAVPGWSMPVDEVFGS